MKIIEQIIDGDFSQASVWLDSASSSEVNAAIECRGKKWGVLHFLADVATRGSVDRENNSVDVVALARKAIERGADIHRGDSDGVKGDTPFNILAPSGLPDALEMGSLLTDCWFEQSVGKRGTKGVDDPSGSHQSTLTQYIAKWSRGAKVEEQLGKIKAMGVNIAKQNGSGWTGLHAAIVMGNVDAVAALSKLYDAEQLKLKTVEDYSAPYGVTFPAGEDALAAARIRISRKSDDRGTSVSLISNIEKCIAIVEDELSHLR